MVSCSVRECDVTRRNNPNKYTFHRFPINLVLRDKWLRIIDRDNWSPYKSSTVCSKHFEPRYFLQRKHRRVLMRDSIPTLAVPIKLKKRRPCSYVNRDISPPPLAEPLPGPSNQEFLIKKCSKLRQKIFQKNRLIKNLKSNKIRISKQLLDLQAVVKELYSRLGLKNHSNDAQITSNDLTAST